MKNDFELIIHSLPKDLEYANIYPIGDLHIGSPDFDQVQWEKWLGMVMDDPNGYALILGDMMDNGLRNSKTNPYQATMRPFEQKKWLVREFGKLSEKGKILGAVQGNHDSRTYSEADMCPLYEAMAKLDIEDVYRENMAFVKISLGERNQDRQATYTFALTHGAGKAKVEKFGYAIDGIDAIISGHTHQPSTNMLAKVVVDTRNNKVQMKSFIHLVVSPFTKLGGYSLKALYAPQDHTKIPYLKLEGKRKDLSIHWV